MSFIDARKALLSLLEEREELKKKEVVISSKALKNEEAIGNPDRQDFPLLRGKEVLLQAEIDGFVGQAFTSDPIAYQGSISDMLLLPEDRHGNYALLVASLNALMKMTGKADHTIHCKNNEPEECAEKVCEEVLKRHGKVKIGIIGYQPSIIENCAQVFGPENVLVTDLSEDNVGAVRYGVRILDGMVDTEKLVEFADVLLATGSVLANGTELGVLDAIGDKPFYFFGTTCAGLAVLNGFSRICPLSK